MCKKDEYSVKRKMIFWSFTNNVHLIAGAVHVSNPIGRQAKGLSHLNLSYCGLTGKGVNMLAHSLSVNKVSHLLSCLMDVYIHNQNFCCLSCLFLCLTSLCLSWCIVAWFAYLYTLSRFPFHGVFQTSITHGSHFLYSTCVRLSHT